MDAGIVFFHYGDKLGKVSVGNVDANGDFKTIEDVRKFEAQIKEMAGYEWVVVTGWRYFDGS